MTLTQKQLDKPLDVQIKDGIFSTFVNSHVSQLINDIEQLGVKTGLQKDKETEKTFLCIQFDNDQHIPASYIVEALNTALMTSPFSENEKCAAIEIDRLNNVVPDALEDLRKIIELIQKKCSTFDTQAIAKDLTAVFNVTIEYGPLPFCIETPYTNMIKIEHGKVETFYLRAHKDSDIYNPDHILKQISSHDLLLLERNAVRLTKRMNDAIESIGIEGIKLSPISTSVQIEPSEPRQTGYSILANIDNINHPEVLENLKKTGLDLSELFKEALEHSNQCHQKIIDAEAKRKEEAKPKIPRLRSNLSNWAKEFWRDLNY